MLPDVPSIAETVPGYDVTPWYGVLAPAHTPAPIVSRLEREFLGVLRRPEVQEKFTLQGAEPTGLASAGHLVFVADTGHDRVLRVDQIDKRVIELAVEL